MIAAGMSDRGKVREKNEDGFSIYLKPDLGLCAVADGMGGHAAGEVASRLALTAIGTYLLENEEKLISGADAGCFLTEMFEYANRKVLEAGHLDSSCSGMGTTLTLLFGLRGDYWIGHIGDTRAYLVTNDSISHLTEDHTLVGQLMRNGQLSQEETSDHPQRHILTRALGTDNREMFDIFRPDLKPGDKILLCSDGLYNLVEDELIHRICLEQENPHTVLSRLIATANERGGNDNITVVLVSL